MAHENMDFLNSPQGRQVRILSEFLAPDVSYETSKVKHTIACFGSARTLPQEEIDELRAKLDPNADNYEREKLRLERLEKIAQSYDDCRELSRRLAIWGKNRPEFYALCTGGGPGIMEAGNRGASDADCLNVGLNIKLPYEQHPNPYISPELNIQFRYFFIRKFWFLFKARALVVFPGGWGTFDELFEVLTLIQTGKIETLPILIFGSEFWKTVVNWDYLVETAVIDPEDMDYMKFSDDIDESYQWLVGELEKRAPKYEGKNIPLGHSFGGIL
ncbi:MAG: LOG family protein [Fibrobacter sp.]|nr:LOG family protein [Fibrobacter sp.]